MPCRCSGHSATTARASQASKRHLPDLSIHRGVLISPPHAFSHQLPALSQQIAVRPRYEATGHRQTGNRTLCQAQQQEEKEKDMVGGFDVDAEPGFLESEAVGIIFKVGFVAFVSAGVAAILLLARPVIDNTIKAFPYRTSGDQKASTPEAKSLIPGLDSGDNQGAEDSIF